jgi:hypothetical protein
MVASLGDDDGYIIADFGGFVNGKNPFAKMFSEIFKTYGLSVKNVL